MDPEVLSPTKQRFNGVTYYRGPKSKYYTNNWGGRRPRLHQAVWSHHHGPIPEGWHIHHINGNVDDNRLCNLECLHPTEHARQHPNTEPWPKAARDAASEWHKSPEGRAWHSKMAKETARRVKTHGQQYRCIQCNKPFTALRNPSGMCGQTCRARRWRYNLPGGKGGIWYD